MNDKRTTAGSAGLNMSEIYHVLFRHKWKILLVWAIGLIASAVVWFAWPVPYQSEAELLVKYISVRNESPIPSAVDPTIKLPTVSGDGMMNSEMQILGSLDLAQQVADLFGPEKLLAKYGGGTNLMQAAAIVREGLTTEVKPGSGVIKVTFRHPDREVVQPVLNHLINSYLKRHGEIQMGLGMMDEFLRRQKVELTSQLRQTESDLREAQVTAGINSPEDLKNLGVTLAAIRTALLNAEVELADHQATLEAMLKLAPTNSMMGSLDATNEPVSDKISSQYRIICKVLDASELKLQTMLSTEGYKLSSDPVKWQQQQIDMYSSNKMWFEHEWPALVQMRPASTTTTPAEQPMVSRTAIFAESTRITGLQVRTNLLNQQLGAVLQQIQTAENGEARIRQLQSTREQQQKTLDYISAGLQRANYDEALSARQNFNISPIESPTPPGQDSMKVLKVVRGMALGTLAAGIALAFLLEMFLDRSLKRPMEVESKLGLPLMLSIPQTNLNGKHGGFSRAFKRVRMLPWKSGEGQNGATEEPPAGSPEALPLEATERLNPFFEALRDRLIMFFEMKNLTYKPKLVAVTSCGSGAGVTTVASGLAASLSETGDGNVLLVDMNVEGGAAHFFHKGQLACGLEDALESDKRDSAMVQDKLYVVSDTPTSDKLPRILHKRFSSLMPKLKASDYDYIIFDMPPMSQISPSSRVARFMDLVLLVVESEKTDRDVARRAGEMLAQSTPNVSIVLNKTRTYVPRRLDQHS